MKLKVENIIDIAVALKALDPLTTLPAKSKWNLMRNMQKCNKVTKNFNEQRDRLLLEVFGNDKKTATNDPRLETFNIKIKEFLGIEEEINLLQLSYAEIVKDDVPFSASSLLVLSDYGLLEGEPT